MEDLFGDSDGEGEGEGEVEVEGAPRAPREDLFSYLTGARKPSSSAATGGRVKTEAATSSVIPACGEKHGREGHGPEVEKSLKRLHTSGVGVSDSEDDVTRNAGGVGPDTDLQGCGCLQEQHSERNGAAAEADVATSRAAKTERDQGEEAGGSLEEAGQRRDTLHTIDALNLRPEKVVQSAHGGPESSSSIQKDLMQRNAPGTCVRIEAAAAEDRGLRHAMEDAWMVMNDSRGDHGEEPRLAFFAVFDGHGGRHAADYARAHVFQSVLSAGLASSWNEGQQIDVKVAKKAIIEGFKRVDEALLKKSAAAGWQDGATAVCSWVLRDMVFVANVGDAKAVLARLPAKQLPTEGVSADHTAKPGDGIPMEAKKEERPKAVIVTREHKAIFPEERARVEKAGGFVANGRLQGRLEVSRAFGDRQFKKVGVSAAPDVHAFKITERERFMVLGCDGFWGVFGPSDAVEFADKLLQEGLSVEVVSKRLVREAVRERRCKDNCTALTIVFSR